MTKEQKDIICELMIKVSEQLKADGCCDCAFWSREEWEEPCRRCKRNYKDYWRKSDEIESDDTK